MSKTLSILRYPGGKSRLYDLVKMIIHENHLQNKVYVEPFAGGFGLGLKLLLNGDVTKTIINDYDYHIYCFWKCVFEYTDKLINAIETADINIQEWHRQKDIYNNYQIHPEFEIGFATLFLNRTNYSGVLKGGPIGGLTQTGKYKIDCRFNKQHIISRIVKVAKFKNQVELYNCDAIQLIQKLKQRENELFFNFDPPYVKRGPALYLNSYRQDDHVKLRNAITQIQTNWIMTYDNDELIKNLYQEYDVALLTLGYSMNRKRTEQELFISNFYHIENSIS